MFRYLNSYITANLGDNFDRANNIILHFVQFLYGNKLLLLSLLLLLLLLLSLSLLLLLLLLLLCVC